MTFYYTSVTRKGGVAAVILMIKLFGRGAFNPSVRDDPFCGIFFKSSGHFDNEASINYVVRILRILPPPSFVDKFTT